MRTPHAQGRLARLHPVSHFLTGGITKRRIQVVNPQGQLGALVAPTLFNTPLHH
jgi:hypothetical protein